MRSQAQTRSRRVAAYSSIRRNESAFDVEVALSQIDIDWSLFKFGQLLFYDFSSWSPQHQRTTVATTRLKRKSLVGSQRILEYILNIRTGRRSN